MAKKRKKSKEDIDLEKLDPDDLLLETVACSILGRTLASYASMLTGREKTARNLVYRLFQAGRKPDRKLEVTARVSKSVRENVKVRTPVQAIEEFSAQYPKEAQVLLRLRDETHSPSEPVLSYGLKDGKSLDDEYLIETLQKMLPITRGPARALYEKIIKPELTKQQEEGGLVDVTMKD